MHAVGNIETYDRITGETVKKHENQNGMITAEMGL